MTDLPFVLLKPLFNMLEMYSCNPALCPALPVHYMHVVLAPVWGRANSGAKLSSNSSGHVPATHSSPTLGSYSSTSYLSPLSQFLSPPGKAIFYLHPISPQTCKPTPYQLLLPLLNWQLPRHRGWLCDQTLGMLCSILVLHGRRKSIWMPLYIGNECKTTLEVIQLLLSTIHSLFYSYREREFGKFPFKGTKCMKKLWSVILPK